MAFHVYILRSASTGRFYVGHTENLSKRMAEHTIATERHRPRIEVRGDLFIGRNSPLDQKPVGGSEKSKGRRAMLGLSSWLERPDRGDHEIWYSPMADRRFPLGHKILSGHAANAVLKQAGIPKQV